MHPIEIYKLFHMKLNNPPCIINCRQSLPTTILAQHPGVALSTRQQSLTHTTSFSHQPLPNLKISPALKYPSVVVTRQYRHIVALVLRASYATDPSPAFTHNSWHREPRIHAPARRRLRQHWQKPTRTTRFPALSLLQEGEARRRLWANILTGW